MLRYLTSGESHGCMLTAILEGMPRGVKISLEDIRKELKRRRQGYGRGSRSVSIEKDEIDITSGVRFGTTTGAPIGITIKNSEWEKGRKKEKPITNPRPGHADLAGMLKYNTLDAVDILERASARSTASQVAIGAVCKKYLENFGIEVFGYVKSIGNIRLDECKVKDILKLKKLIEASPVRCPDKTVTKEMINLIDRTKKEGDTLGGTVYVEIANVPVGLGSHVHWDRRLDTLLSAKFMSVPSVKSVCIGNPDVVTGYGSEIHDEIFYSKSKGCYRKTNNAGGIEGGISNGENIVATLGLKPIPTLLKPLNSINLKTKKSVKAESVRSDVSVAASAVVAIESMAAFVIAREHIAQLGKDYL